MLLSVAILHSFIAYLFYTPWKKYLVEKTYKIRIELKKCDMVVKKKKNNISRTCTVLLTSNLYYAVDSR